jgi:serine O-acetyltransferase
VRDVQAAFDGDPAATNLDEVILAYPGVLAVSVYRIAHALYDLGVPMMARIMTEWAHSKTGCDIHPGAKIGAGFFIDHATGVVIGETTVIGDRREALSGRDAGRAVVSARCERPDHSRRKRHPTVESGATLYANATVLGGQTVVGADSVIGGSVFLTRSVPPRSRVSLKEPELRVASRDGAPIPTRSISIFDRRRAAPSGARYIILPSIGTSSSATMLMILISGLIAGPAVSL